MIQLFAILIVGMIIHITSNIYICNLTHIRNYILYNYIFVEKMIKNIFFNKKKWLSKIISFIIHCKLQDHIKY